MVSADEHGLATCDYPHLDYDDVEAYRFLLWKVGCTFAFRASFIILTRRACTNARSSGQLTRAL